MSGNKGSQNCGYCDRKKLFETEGIFIEKIGKWFCCYKCRTEGFDDAICQGCSRKNRWCVCETPEHREVKQWLKQEELKND